MDSVLKTNLLCDTLNIASIPLVRERNILNKCYNEADDYYEEIPSQSSSPTSSTPGSVASLSVTDFHSTSAATGAVTGNSSLASDSGCDISSSVTKNQEISSNDEPVNNKSETDLNVLSKKKKLPLRMLKFKKPVKRAHLSYKVFFNFLIKK